jgi:hypothetical protein
MRRGGERIKIWRKLSPESLEINFIGLQKKKKFFSPSLQRQSKTRGKKWGTKQKKEKFLWR